MQNYNSQPPFNYRAKIIAKKYFSLLLIGTGYLCFIKLTGYSIPCLFRLLTGYLCPGCGITTMLVALAHGDITAAFTANKALFLAAPYLLWLIVRRDYVWILTGQIPAIAHSRILFLLVYFIAFTIFRNL